MGGGSCGVHNEGGEKMDIGMKGGWVIWIYREGEIRLKNGYR